MLGAPSQTPPTSTRCAPHLYLRCGRSRHGKRAQYEASPRCASSVPVPVPPLLLLAPWLGHSLAPLAAELVCLALRLAGGARMDVARAPALPNLVGRGVDKRLDAVGPLWGFRMERLWRGDSYWAWSSDHGISLGT